MNPDLTYKLLKYLVQGIIIYLLFKFVPREPMNDKDILLITAIVILSCGVLENVYSVYFSPKTDTQTPVSEAQCNSYCSRPQSEQKEHMGNLSADSIKSALDSMASSSSSAIASHVAPHIAPNPVPHVEQPRTQPPHVQPPHVQPPHVQPPHVQPPHVQPPHVTSHVQPPHVTSHVQPPHVQPPHVTSHVQPSHVTPPHNQIKNNRDGSHEIKPVHNPQATSQGARHIDDVMGNEQAYNYIDYNSMPVSYDTGSFESGYSFLPPEKWYPVPPHPPVCVAEKQCPVCPVFTNGTYIDLKEWDQSRRITPPDEINVHAVEGKLNSGR